MAGMNIETKKAIEAVRAADPEGLLRPEAVVEAARDDSSPLHSYFTWDDTEAARRQRLHEARHLIRVAVTVLPNSTEPVRAFVSLSTERGKAQPGRVTGGSGYRLITKVLTDEQAREQLLADALRELEAFRRKYARLAELAPVFKAMAKVRPAKSGKKVTA